MRLVSALTYLASAITVACGPTDFVTTAPDAGAPRPDAPPNPEPSTYPDAPACGQSVPIEVIENLTPPDVVLVVDKSGSMRDRLVSSDPATKFQIMRDALRVVVEGQDQLIYFGLSLFPTNNSCGSGSVIVDPAPGMGGEIVNRLNQVTYPDGATPTHTTLGQVRTYYAGRTPNPNGRYVLLATDGEPNCGPGGQNDDTDNESVAAVASLAADGVKTYVIGFGEGTRVNPTTLQRMAEAGQTGDYFQASSAADLAAALEAISGEVILPSCHYDLAEEPEDPTRIAVDFDGAAVPRTSSHTNGWDYDPATNSITFYGSACAELQSGSVDAVGVQYGCEGPTID